MDVVELVCGRERKRKLEKISLSNHIIRCRKGDMSRGILFISRSRCKASVSLQVDDSTEVSNST